MDDSINRIWDESDYLNTSVIQAATPTAHEADQCDFKVSLLQDT